MVAGLFAPAIVLVDACTEEAIGCKRAEQQVIDAEARVALPGAGLIIPEGPDAARGMARPEAVGPALREQGAEGTIKAATLVIAGQRLRVFDSPVPHAFDFTPAISFFVDCTSAQQLRDLAGTLQDGGAALMPLNNYGFSQLFAWVNDRFGVSWQLNLA